MTKMRVSLVVAAIVLLGAGLFLATRGLRAQIPPLSTSRSIARADLINDVLKSQTAFDCSAAMAMSSPPTPTSTTPIFQSGAIAAIAPPTASTSLYLGLWSNAGDVIAFSSPTSQVHFLPAAGSSAGQPYAVSQNQLWLYKPANHHWTMVSSDASSPRFSTTGSDLLFFTTTTLMDYSLTTQQLMTTRLTLPNTSAALLTSWPLSNEAIFSPAASSSPSSSWPRIDLTSLDSTLLAPNERIAIVTLNNQPAVSLLLEQDGSDVPILKNCGEAAHFLTWSQDSTAIAFPVRDPKETDIYVLSASTGVAHRVATFTGRALVNGMSFSPDGGYLAVSVGSGSEASPKIWIVPITGSAGQVIVEGIAPRWSPTGRSLLYASAGPATPYQWYLLSLQSTRLRDLDH